LYLSPSVRIALLIGLLVAVAALLPGSRLYAHDFWIEPTTFQATPGDEVALILRVGQDLQGDRLPYINDWFSDYRVVAPSSTQPVNGMMGDDPAGSFVALEPGVYVVGYRSTRDFVEMKPEKFRSYLEDEGLERIIALRAEQGDSARPARENYSRCAKSLIKVGTGAAGETYDEALGYTLELIPEKNPYEMKSGDALPLRLLYLGAPIEGVLVQGLVSTAPDRKVSARTDEQGRVALRLDQPGVWLIKAVHIIATPPEVKTADWESFWASLTFRLPGG